MNKRISIIVTARNYGQLLSECLQSCLNQTIKPFEVIYSDDCSEDNSLLVAKTFPVKIVKHKTHVGVVKARNDGADASKGEILVFVDGDDILTSDFLEKHLEVFDETTPFTYCAAQAFGLKDNFWNVFAWNVRNLWDRNFVNTSTMMWRDAFEKSGKWQDNEMNTMWDWSLAIRLAKLGTPRKSHAVLKYRQHSESWSFTREKNGANWEKHKEALVSFRKTFASVSIGLVYSGRLPGIFDLWMESLVNDISVLKSKPELIVYNNSEINLSEKLKKYEKSFSKIKVINNPEKIKFSNEIERRDRVCEFLANAYNMILENSGGDIIHLREDDIVTPDGGFEKLYDFSIGTGLVNPAVAGLYFNRNPNWKKFVGGFYNEQNPRASKEIEKLPSDKKPIQIDFTGTGCLLFWRDQCPKLFKSHVEGIQAHDWAWCLELKKAGQKLFVLPEVICKHYINETEFSQPLDKFEINAVNNFTKITEPKNGNGHSKNEPAVIIKKCWQDELKENAMLT